MSFACTAQRVESHQPCCEACSSRCAQQQPADLTNTFDVSSSSTSSSSSSSSTSACADTDSSHRATTTYRARRLVRRPMSVVDDGVDVDDDDDDDDHNLATVPAAHSYAPPPGLSTPGRPAVWYARPNLLLTLLALLASLHRTVAIPIDNALVGAEAIQTCTNASAVDVVFILDSSGSIGDGSFEQQRRFVSMVIDKLAVAPDKARIAIVQYSEDAKLEIGLGQYPDAQKNQWALGKIQFLAGTTFTGNAMKFALDNAFKNARGGNIAKVGVVLTDGQSQDGVATAAEALRNADVTMYAIGVTNLVNLNQLYQITGTPTRVFTVESFDRLDRRLAKLITQEMCKYNFTPGVPDIVCQADRIGVRATAKNDFEGWVFVKNHFHESECRRGRNSFSNPRKIGMDVKFNSCDVKRWRSLNPRGIFVETTIMFMFHNLFLTKVDQAVRIQCFYMEADKTVEAPLEVSMITTQFRDDQYLMPTCRYSIRSQAPDGPVIKFAAIGQKVFHRWECIEQDQRYDTFGMLVHSCYVDDSRGDRVDLIDPNGCGQDIHLVQTPEYSSDLRVAVRESHVFKYADRPVLEFQCQITVCIKYDGGCEGITPPDCPRLSRRNQRRGLLNPLGRGKRSAYEDDWLIADDRTQDVLAEPITVLGISPDGASPFPPSSQQSVERQAAASGICLTEWQLYTIVPVLIGVNVLLVAGVVIALVRMQQRQMRAVAVPKLT